MTADLEEGATLSLDFAKLASVADTQVLPCAVQDSTTNEVILVAYVNERALRRAVETRSAVFWSTSRDELREKGATSGAATGPPIVRGHTISFVDDTAVAALIARGQLEVGTDREPTWFDELDAHRGELDAFVTTAIEHRDDALLAQLGASLWPYWTRRAPDGGTWLDRVADVLEGRSVEASPDVALALYGAGLSAFRRGENERCRTLSQRALDVASAVDSAEGRAKALIGLSRADFRDHDWIAGLEHARMAGAVAAEAGLDRDELTALHMQAEISRAAGDYAQALPLYERLLEADRAAQDPRLTSMELYNLGSVLLQLGDLDRAAACLDESLTLARSSNDESQIAYTGLAFAGLASRRGDPSAAGRILRAVEDHFARTGELLDPAEQMEMKSHRAAAITAGADVFAAAYEAGRGLAVLDALGRG